MRKSHLLIFSALALAVILAGCSTGSTAAKREYTTFSQEGLSVKVYYLDSRELYSVYGNRNNPFARHVSGPAITLEIVATADQQARIAVSEATLTSEQGVQKPVSKQWMIDYWQKTLMPKGPRKNTSSVYSGWSEKYVLEVIESEVLPDVAELSAGTETRGLILFDTLRNVKTPVTFKLPVYDQSGSPMETFEYEFSL
jgi:hypothetical protein